MTPKRCECGGRARVLYTHDNSATGEAVREHQCKACGARWSSAEFRAVRDWVRVSYAAKDSPRARI